MGEILENSLTEMDWLLQLNGFSSGDSDIQECTIGKDEDFESIPTTPQRDQFANYKVKPPYSYTHLITSAINSTTKKRMALSEIYQWIRDNYPYYRTAAPGWKNSVRHNLSLNKNFVKLARRKDEPGKGSYWALASFVTKGLDRKFHPVTEMPLRCHVNTSNNNNNINNYHHLMTDQETEIAVQSIGQHKANQSSSDSGDLTETDDITSEVELAHSVLSCHNNTDLSQHVEWLKNSCSMKLGTSWSSSSNIDLDLLMESLKAVENGKKSLSADEFADLSASLNFLSSSQTSQVKFICRSPTHSSTQQFSELQPLALPSNIADCDRYASMYTSLRSSSPLPPYILDHTETVSSCCQQLPPISVCSKYPQRTIAVEPQQKSALVLGSSSCHDTDDIDDDFNWDSLIAKDNEVICAT